MVVTDGNWKGFDEHYDRVNLSEVGYTIFQELGNMGVIALDSEVKEIIKRLFVVGYVIIPRKSLVATDAIIAKVDAMREVQKLYFRSRKAEGTPYPSGETKLLLKVSKELEIELDGLLRNWKKEVGNE